MPDQTFAVGDKVRVSPLVATAKQRDAVFEITAVPRGRNGVNYTVTPLSGGIGLRGRAECFVLATDDEVARAQAHAEAVGPALVAGQVVRAKPGASVEGVFVVLGDAKKTRDCYRLARFGGDGGRYYASVPAASLALVEVDAETLVSA